MTPDLFRYRRFIWKRALLDLRYRYATTGLGALWNILHPLLTIAVYSFVFGYLLKRHFEELTVPYVIFLCAGMLPWIGFTECIIKGSKSFKANSAYLKKLPVPEQVFTAQTALTATLNLGISYTLLIVISVCVGIAPGWTWFLLPIPMLLLQAAGFGLGTLFGTLNVFIPDIGEAIPIIVRLAVWTAPVIFPMSFLASKGLTPFVALNPATASIVSIRQLFIDHTIPSPGLWAGMVGWVLITWLVSFAVLRALRPEIRDVL